MNYSVIKELFFERCNIDERLPVTDGHKKIAKKLFEFEESIKKYLPEKDSERIIAEYSLFHGELNSETESTSFTEGFKIGLLVGLEVFSDLLKK